MCYIIEYLTQCLTEMCRADTKEAYEADRDEILTHAPDYSDVIYGFTVGSETLYRHEQDESKGLSVDELIAHIQDFKDKAGKKGLNQPVGTADSWNKFQDGTADKLIPEVGIL